MRKFLTATTAALALAGMSVAAATPAQAYWHGGGFRGGGWHGGYGGGWRGGYGGGWGYHRGWGGGGYALGAGLAGLAVGAAIADRGYYGRGYYGYPGYAYGPGYYGGYRGCWRWDPYAGRYFRAC